MKKSPILIFFLGIIITAVALASALTLLANAPVEPFGAADKTASVEKELIQHATLLATGDLVMHPPLYDANIGPDGQYQFDTFFAKVKDEISGADLAFANFECPSDPSLPANGYPVFNAPQGLIPYLKEVGFDALATANNHSLDAGLSGLEATIADMKKHDMPYFGTRLTPKEGNLILEANGIRIGLCGWSAFYNGLEVNVPEEKQFQISPLTVENIKKDIDELKSNGADLIVCWPHWGTEYAVTADDDQKEMAKALVRAGADVILGSHPHVLEPVEWLEVDGRKAWIIYSMGNAISNQREQYLGTMDTEIGVFVKLDIEKKGDGQATIKEVRLVPTYVNLFTDENGRTQYEVLNLEKAINDAAYSEEQKNRFITAKNRAEALLSGKG